ncbi:ABC transporter permease [Clostridium chromiireducens]|uniref:ABC transporter permease n=1 Tax=Clostridium chromiireducens TaxID=225345 RepID=A0A399IM36_9CLOT|nr:ABC transporter permease [Clostridium chromiireducens]RII34103.1 ABC transporter permease [Clostridium chromiireducens]
MMKYVLAEIFKYRKAKIRFCTIVLFIPIVISFIIYGFNEKYNYLIIWEDYFNVILNFLNDIVAPIVYGIISAYIFGHEYETKTMNVMFTYPINRMKLLISKLGCIFYIIASTLILAFFTSLILGLLIKHESLTIDFLIYYFVSFLKMIIFHFMLVCITCAVAIYTKSVLPSIIFVISATFINLVVVNTHLSAFYPWSAPVLLSPHEGVGRTYIPYTLNMISLVVIFLIGLTISIRKYKYVE